MNVMFVDPKWNYELGYNLGLAYVLTAVEKKHAVSLLDMTFQSGFQEKYIVKKVKKETPDIVGISVVTGANYVHTLRIAQAIKRLNSDILIVLGGVLPTLYPDLIIHEPLIDALCIGEGEVTFVEYVDKIENKEPPLVKGIWYKEKDGTVIKNELRPLINNLDDIAFPNWDYWDMDKHVKASRFMSGALACGASRACPYDCSFCFEPVLRKAVPGKSYRTRSAENIIREIEFNVNKYGKYGISHIDFYDSILGFDRQQLEKFCALFVKHGLDKKLTWAGVTRVEMITEEWARCVAQANCVRLAIGVESIDDVVR
ncbi:MAG: B12-binding domain-containing radical SAM protein, partial [Candidatus Omnitrophica bacterium]|nr:B12-binding domain-containing radical SAM protein [Candidatus Omnitrophota bacterium]